MKMFKNLSLFVLTAAFTAVAVVGCQKQMDDLAPAQAENPTSMLKATSTAPFNIVTSGLDRTNATLSWTKPNGIFLCNGVKVGFNAFAVEYRIVGASNWTFIGIASVATTTQYLTGLTQNTQYEYRVGARYLCNGSQVFEYSPITQFYTYCENYDTDHITPRVFPMGPQMPDGTQPLSTATCGLNSATDVDYYTFNVNSTSTCGNKYLNVGLTGGVAGYSYDFVLEKLVGGNWSSVVSGSSSAPKNVLVGTGGTYRVRVFKSATSAWIQTCITLGISTSCGM